jgi:hypothetical protein
VTKTITESGTIASARHAKEILVRSDNRENGLRRVSVRPALAVIESDELMASP